MLVSVLERQRVILRYSGGLGSESQLDPEFVLL